MKSDCSTSFSPSARFSSLIRFSGWCSSLTITEQTSVTSSPGPSARCSQTATLLQETLHVRSLSFDEEACQRFTGRFTKSRFWVIWGGIQHGAWKQAASPAEATDGNIQRWRSVRRCQSEMNDYWEARVFLFHPCCRPANAKHLKYRHEPKHLDRVAPDILKSIARFGYKVVPEFLLTTFCQVK